MVLKPGREAEAEAIFRKWELDFAVIGEVTDTGHMVLEFNGEVVCDIPLGPLADEAPEYDRPHMGLDEYKVWAQVKPLDEVPESTDIAADLLKLMASPNLASRRWIWEQYDQSVGGDTVQRPGGDAAVVRVHGTKKALAITTDCTPRYCYADPYEGGKQAIAEAYRNLCAVGAKPLAVTNCLNFGNPQRPEIMAQFVECLRGMGDACRALDFPIVSGNVSLYNESKATGGGSAILPTPAIGGVGLLEDWEQSATIGFKAEGDLIWVLNSIPKSEPELGQSLWMREIFGHTDGAPPEVHLDQERQTGQLVRKLINAGLVNAVHDVSDGGLLIAIAEMALAGNLGAEIEFADLFDSGHSVEAGEQSVIRHMFSENQGRFVVTVPRDLQARFFDCVERAEIEATLLGTVWGTEIKLGDGDEWVLGTVSLADLRAAHESFFPKLMGSELAPEF
jgi:phosphoribosylformylglycinamidine synthase